MVSVQLDFALRTTTNVKTVHLLGSWDRYAGQIPLSKTKPGSWKGTFRFQNNTIKCGGTYWYYYILDGYHVSHDPTITYTVEPTTQRKLNVLRIPANAQSSSSSKKSVPRAAPIGAAPIVAPVSAPVSAIPCGRGISPSRIASPKPSRPYASRRVREFDDDCTADELVSRLEGASLSSSSTSTSSSHSYSRSSSAYNSESESDSELSSVFSSSPASSMTSLLSAGSPRSNASSRLSKSSRSSRGGSPSSTSSSCSCQRYGITRNGQRVKLEYDCHGSICGDSESGCSDED